MGDCVWLNGCDVFSKGVQDHPIHNQKHNAHKSYASEDIRQNY